MLKKGFVIAIDGPAGSGKDTLSKLLVAKYHAIHLNSGSYFRCIALYCIQHHVDMGDESAVARVVAEARIQISDRILLNGEDVTDEIREQEVSMGSSKVALIGKVQEEMITFHRKIAQDITEEGKILIVDGRNVGTAIFPDAPIRVMLTASVKERSKRRLMQLGWKESELDKLITQTKERDSMDRDRPLYPLVSDPEAHGYEVLDNSSQTVDESFAQIEKLLQEKGLL